MRAKIIEKRQQPRRLSPGGMRQGDTYNNDCACQGKISKAAVSQSRFESWHDTARTRKENCRRTSVQPEDLGENEDPVCVRVQTKTVD